jgi:hypothetical protein
MGKAVRHSVRNVTGNDLFQIGEAMVWLVISNFLIHWVPFRRWHGWIGNKDQLNEKTKATQEQLSRANRIRRNVKRANKILLNSSRCFAISLAIKKMLYRRNIPGILFLGVNKKENKSLRAHAWVKCDGITLYGGSLADNKYKQLLKFA